MAKNIFLALVKDPAIRGRVLLVLLVVAILVSAILLSGPKPAAETATPAAESTLAASQSSEPVATPISEEEIIRSEYGITTGVIVGTAGILLIIFTGTILELRRNPKD